MHADFLTARILSAAAMSGKPEFDIKDSLCIDHDDFVTSVLKGWNRLAKKKERPVGGASYQAKATVHAEGVTSVATISCDQRCLIATIEMMVGSAKQYFSSFFTTTPLNRTMAESLVGLPMEEVLSHPLTNGNNIMIDGVTVVPAGTMFKTDRLTIPKILSLPVLP